MSNRIVLLILALLVIPGGIVSAAQDDEEPVVRGVMFWLDTCPHCHYVIDEVLPPLQQQYGDQLDIVLLELDSEANAGVFYAAGAAAGLTPEELGVPMLLVSDNLMMGSTQIPAELPGLIERYLAEGGVDLPDIPGLAALLPSVESAAIAELPPAVEPTATAAETTAPAGSAAPTEVAESVAEPGGISGSIPAFVVLAGMVLALGFVAVMLFLARSGSVWPPEGRWVSAAIPALAAAGIVVAGYLAYVETQAVAAICGPVGNCNTVQTSEYARLFGVPVGVIGIAGYVAMLGTWLWGRSGNVMARGLLLGMAVIGVVFSIYLTWLELFVIYAVCLWCVSSAVIMTLLMLAAAAWLAQARLTAEADMEGRAARAQG